MYHGILGITSESLDWKLFISAEQACISVLLMEQQKEESSEHSVVVDVPQPSAIKEYNRFMGGVDKSNRYISYH